MSLVKLALHEAFQWAERMREDLPGRNSGNEALSGEVKSLPVHAGHNTPR